MLQPIVDFKQKRNVPVIVDQFGINNEAGAGDADVRAAEFFAPVEWEALERGGGLACYGAFKTPDTTDAWILFSSREERSSRAE